MCQINKKKKYFTIGLEIHPNSHHTVSVKKIFIRDFYIVLSSTFFLFQNLTLALKAIGLDYRIKVYINKTINGKDRSLSFLGITTQ